MGPCERGPGAARATVRPGDPVTWESYYVTKLLTPVLRKIFGRQKPVLRDPAPGTVFLWRRFSTLPRGTREPSHGRRGAGADRLDALAGGNDAERRAPADYVLRDPAR